jgi:hypothetical protein
LAARQGKPLGRRTGLIERYSGPDLRGDPDAKIIHMVRDPVTATRDPSPGPMVAGGGGATALDVLGPTRERHTRRHPDNYIVVRYEDMVLHTDATVRHVCVPRCRLLPRMLEMAGAPRRDRLVAAGRARWTAPVSGLHRALP